ncbi:MAG: HlyD family type I secretion periplasmic adaptor subunit [Pseudomonadota bacterium]
MSAAAMETDRHQITAAAGGPRQVATSARRAIILGLVSLGLLFGAGGAWAYFARISGAVIASGQVAVVGNPKTIQHLDGGIVAEIAVRNGDTVAAGDLLVRLDDTLLVANQNILSNRLQESVARRSRLLAERDRAAFPRYDTDLLQIFQLDLPDTIKDGQTNLFETRIQARTGQVAQLEERIKQLRNQIEGVEALRTSGGIQQDLLREEFEALQSLADQGLTSKSRVLALARQSEEVSGRMAEQSAELARIQNAIGESRIQILQIEREFQEGVLAELREVEQAINEVTQQLHSTSEQLRRVQITAPVAGVVHELAVFTIGGVVGPGSPVLQIVPQNAAFEIEAGVEPQFVDNLYVGQPARLIFTAFNQRTTPELQGQVAAISPNVTVNEITGVPQYIVRLNVGAKDLEKLGDRIIIPGMPVDAFISTAERSPLDYLLKPLSDQVNRAFREE